ncbi:MAG TPA: hypothetical protein PKI92_00195 [Candidatus Woesebacteria bacterium]|nr:hypothetical protein [Candidatus Woesebacteria bacterium]HPR99598.1 hypothetical protein [Candidatus Woesebacteria bacterium]
MGSIPTLGTQMINLILGIVAIVGYLYLSWRTLRDNYREEDIVAFSWVALLFFLVGGRLTYGFEHWGDWAGRGITWLEFWKIYEFNIWGGTTLWLSFALLISKDKDWKAWAFLENSLLSFWFLLTMFGVITRDWKLLLALSGAYGLSLWLKEKYRSLIWYKSGKKGFLFFWFFFCFWLIFAFITKIWWLLAFCLLFGVGLFILGDDKFSK